MNRTWAHKILQTQHMCENGKVHDLIFKDINIWEKGNRNVKHNSLYLLCFSSYYLHFSVYYVQVHDCKPLTVTFTINTVD